MAKAANKLGKKYTCYSCGGKFYDLNRPEPICPKCGANQNEAPSKKASKPAPQPQPVQQPKAESAKEAEIVRDEDFPAPDDVFDDTFPADDDMDLGADFFDDEEESF